jgi:hypothetical protein
MNWRFWEQPWFWEVVRQVVIALLVALLSVLGYDRQVAIPREEALLAGITAGAVCAEAE